MVENEKMVIQAIDLEIVDDLTVPTILIDSIAGVVNLNGVLVFGCTQTVLEVFSATDMKPKRKIAVRLAVPTSAVPSIAQFFADQMAQLQSDGTLTIPQEISSEDGTNIV